MPHYAMAIDTRRCIGCHTCSVVCKTANNLPKNVWYNNVVMAGGATLESGTGSFPNVAMSFMPTACQHCANPACVAACPTGATSVADDGIVVIDADSCIGCQACMEACPYGARTLIDAEPVYYVDASLGDPLAREHVGNTVEKCDFCHDRLQRGEVPACMELCPGRARWWGDLDDPQSDVCRAIEGRDYELLQEEAGTQPSVYYLK